MKIIDEKGRVFGKISIIDVFVVIFIGLLCVVGVYKYLNKETATDVQKEKENLVITFIAEESPSYVPETLKIGKSVRETVWRSDLGTVVDFKIEPSISYATTFQGDYIKTTKEGYNSVEITINCEGYFDDTGARIDGQLFLVGKYINIEVGEGIYWGRLSSIKSIGG